MPTALTTTPANPAPAAAKRPIFDRPETILGVCESLGDDFGISGNWFRAALFPLILWQPLWTVVGYGVLALVILASRLIFPDVRADVATPSSSLTGEPDRAAAATEARDDYQLAA